MKTLWAKVAVVVMLSLVQSVRAGETLTPSMAAGVDLQTAYIFRAVVYNDGYVVQPWFETAVGPVTLGVWANMDLDDYGGTLEKNKFSEVDLTVKYALPVIAGFDISLGVAEYLFPNVPDGEGGALPGTREVILSVGRPLVGGLSAKTVLSYDVDQVDDYHASLRLTYAYEVVPNLAVSIFGQGGYVGKRFSPTGKSGLYDYDVRFSLTYSCMENLQVGITGGYTGSLDTDVLPDPAENAYGGFSVVTFF